MPISVVRDLEEDKLSGPERIHELRKSVPDLGYTHGKGEGSH